MARIPSIPCVTCGKLCHRSKRADGSYYPEGHTQMCWECRRTAHARICETCDQPFIARKINSKGTLRRYCSNQCHGIAMRKPESEKTPLQPTADEARAFHLGVKYEPVNRELVYKRDKWRCGICHKKVNPKLKAPHPMRKSLDHIIPMSRGGDHTYANVQLA